MLLAVSTRSGSTPQCSMANILPVRPIPLWISSATKTMPLSWQILINLGKYSGGGVTKPPSPMIGFDDQGSRAFRRDMADKEVLQIVSAGGVACGVGEAERTAIAVGARHAIDVGHEGAEPEFVGFDLAGKGHGHVGAAVKAVFKADNRLPFGVMPGDFNRVFHGLRRRCWQTRPSWEKIPASVRKVFPPA